MSYGRRAVSSRSRAPAASSSPLFCALTVYSGCARLGA